LILGDRLSRPLEQDPQDRHAAPTNADQLVAPQQHFSFGIELKGPEFMKLCHQQSSSALANIFGTFLQLF
jgi:hypothetical protein